MKKLIFHLGGNINRADLCIEIANQYGDIPILVSSEKGDVLEYYTSRGISEDRVFIDNEAHDTVTNFTTTFKRIKDEFKADRVWIVTDYFHMKRSMLIAKAIFWRTSIIPVGFPLMGINKKEPLGLLIRDMWRAWVWRLFSKK